MTLLTGLMGGGAGVGGDILGAIGGNSTGSGLGNFLTDINSPAGPSPQGANPLGLSLPSGGGGRGGSMQQPDPFMQLFQSLNKNTGPAGVRPEGPNLPGYSYGSNPTGPSFGSDDNTQDVG